MVCSATPPLPKILLRLKKTAIHHRVVGTIGGEQHSKAGIRLRYFKQIGDHHLPSSSHQKATTYWEQQDTFGAESRRGSVECIGIMNHPNEGCWKWELFPGHPIQHWGRSMFVQHPMFLCKSNSGRPVDSARNVQYALWENNNDNVCDDSSHHQFLHYKSQLKSFISPNVAFYRVCWVRPLPDPVTITHWCFWDLIDIAPSDGDWRCLFKRLWCCCWCWGKS